MWEKWWLIDYFDQLLLKQNQKPILYDQNDVCSTISINCFFKQNQRLILSNQNANRSNVLIDYTWENQELIFFYQISYQSFPIDGTYHKISFRKK